MSKVRMDADEWYPVYSVRPGDRFGLEVEASAEQLERWGAALDAFEVAQSEMGALYAAAQVVQQQRAQEANAAKEAAEKAERERVAQERREASQKREAERAAMWQRIEESGGHVYDAQGRHVGIVRPASGGVSSGVRLEPGPE